jgi:hypothetical protein
MCIQLIMSCLTYAAKSKQTMKKFRDCHAYPSSLYTCYRWADIAEPCILIHIGLILACLSWTHNGLVISKFGMLPPQLMALVLVVRLVNIPCHCHIKGPQASEQYSVQAEIEITGQERWSISGSHFPQFILHEHLLFPLYKYALHVTQESLRMICFVDAHSIMSCGIIFWGNSTYSHLIFKIPKKNSENYYEDKK